MAAVKMWFRRFRPLRLYIVLVLTTAYFLTQLVVSHVTHALTLLVDSYHVLCNLIALIGCIITVKYGSPRVCEGSESKQELTKNNLEELKILSMPTGTVKYASKNCGETERQLKNTFGWARIDVLVMLIGCVFLASLCFSLFVEALQTLIHISHLDEMHHPIPVLHVGFVGLALNLICYLLIGGYTYHQGSFLHVTEEGDVVLQSVTEQSISNGQRRLSSQTRKVHIPLLPPKRQGVWETCRDVIGCIFVIICAAIVYYTDRNVAKYVDPIISIISASLLLIFSYPYMKESCLILLQTIPDHINMGSLETELINAFPNCIVNIHDFHVWQLTVDKTISTVHIIFQNPHVYIQVSGEIKKFFEEKGISHVTVQPEFFKDMNSVELISSQCLVNCTDEKCLNCQCCSSSSDLRSISISSLTKSVKKDNIKYVMDTHTIRSGSLPSSMNNILPKEMKRHLDKSDDLIYVIRQGSSLCESDRSICSGVNIAENNTLNDGFLNNSLKSELICATNRKIRIENNLNKKCSSEPTRVGNIINSASENNAQNINNSIASFVSKDVVSLETLPEGVTSLRKVEPVSSAQIADVKLEQFGEDCDGTECLGSESVEKLPDSLDNKSIPKDNNIEITPSVIVHSTE